MQDGQSLIFSYSKLWCMIGFPHFKQASFKKCNLLKQSLHIEYVLVSFIGLSQIMHEIFLGYIKSSIVSLKDLSIDFISSIFFISFIYNGDIGYIYYIDKEKKEIFVIFDSLKIVTYKYDELDELDHSFCTTIHKSQGSEFPIVVIPMAWAPPMLLSRNLLYTAVTRAKKQVVLVGEVKYLEFMIKNNRSNDRYSNLAVKLNKFKKEGLLIEDNE